jgi:hypothetical protein
MLRKTKEIRRYFVSSLDFVVFDHTDDKTAPSFKKDMIEVNIRRSFDQESGNVDRINVNFSMDYVHGSLEFSMSGEILPKKDKAVIEFRVNMPSMARMNDANQTVVFAAIKKGLAVCEHLVEKLPSELEPEAKRQTGILLNENRIRSQWEQEIMDSKPESPAKEPPTYAKMIGRKIWSPESGIGVVTVANHKTRVLHVEWEKSPPFKAGRRYLVNRVSANHRKNCLWIEG